MRRPAATILRELALAREALRTAEMLMVRAQHVVTSAARNHEDVLARMQALERELAAAGDAC